MDDTSTLIDAENLHLTKNGVRNYVMFGLFVAFIAAMVSGIMYVTATTSDRFKADWGVE